MVFEHKLFEHMVIEHMVLEHMVLEHMVFEHVAFEPVVFEHGQIGAELPVGVDCDTRRFSGCCAGCNMNPQPGTYQGRKSTSQK